MRWLALVLLLAAGPAFAVEPSEILDNPALEQRAREISQNLRCLVCRNESIDESHADLARDLRLLVRERLLAGDSDEQVIGFVVERYGEFVLLRPQANGSNLILWGAGPGLLVLAAGIATIYVRRRRVAATDNEDLSEAERDRLSQILRS